MVVQVLFLTAIIAIIAAKADLCREELVGYKAKYPILHRYAVLPNTCDAVKLGVLPDRLCPFWATGVSAKACDYDVEPDVSISSNGRVVLVHRNGKCEEFAPLDIIVYCPIPPIKELQDQSLKPLEPVREYPAFSLMDAFSEAKKRESQSSIMNKNKGLSNDIERMSSFALLVNFINSSFVLCFCGFCVVIVEKWNELVYKTFLLTALCQTWMLCWCGQRLTESSEGVSTALYNSGWYKASKKIKSSMFIMMHRSQKQVTVTTYGFSVLCLASYTTIMKSAWSYFTLVLNIYKQ